MEPNKESMAAMAARFNHEPASKSFVLESGKVSMRLVRECVGPLVERMAEYEARIAALHSKLDKSVQTQSAMSKHVQSLERKLGDLLQKK